jgi:glycosyltransferase involved in cell wall biosynthesis
MAGIKKAFARMDDVALSDGLGLEGATVIEVVASIAPESFGLGYAALHLAAALDRNGTNTYLVSVDKEIDAYQACEEARFPRDKVLCGSLLGPARFRFSPSLVRGLSKIPNDGRLILHLHGLWTYMSYMVRALRQEWNCPLVLSPHGSLEPYALKISPRKKALVSFLYERRNLLTASCMWALSEQEKASIRAYGYRGRVAVLPNGVNPASECSSEDLAAFRAKHEIGPDSRVMLFLSRITPKKNLPLLLKTFAENMKWRREWLLVIAGSDEGGHIDEIRALIKQLQIEKSTRIIGPVIGKEKACAFTSASAFVLPSYSEGLPIAVLEAMEYGKPIVVTDGWTLPVATSTKFGWRASTTESDFGSVLLEVMSTPENLLADIGRNARAVARESFSWDTIAQKASSLYGTLLVEGERQENSN